MFIKAFTNGIDATSSSVQSSTCKKSSVTNQWEASVNNGNEVSTNARNNFVLVSLVHKLTESLQNWKHYLRVFLLIFQSFQHWIDKGRDVCRIVKHKIGDLPSHLPRNPTCNFSDLWFRMGQLGEDWVVSWTKNFFHGLGICSLNSRANTYQRVKVKSPIGIVEETLDDLKDAVRCLLRTEDADTL